VYRDTEAFLDDHDDGKDVIETVLAVDERKETWEFSDVELDSGTFGELVSTSVIEKVDGEYYVADQKAVQAALDDEKLVIENEESGFEFNIDIDYTKIGGLLGALLVVVGARITQYSSVFQKGLVVSPGNDQYRYRFWMERLLADSSGPLDFDVLVGAPWGYYAESWNERPFTHATNWFVTELIGGDKWAADMVAAWLPIVMTTVLAVIVYKLAVVLTEDARIGIGSVLALALAPVHVVYTQVGWLGNRPHQFLWFGLLILTLVWLAKDVKKRRETHQNEKGIRAHLTSRETWIVVAGLGIALAFWTHSWTGSASLFFPLLGYLGLRVLMDVRENVSPGLANLSIVAGISLGTVIAVALHVVWDWHGILAIGMAVLGFVGTIVLVTVGELWYRTGRSAKQLLVFQAVISVVSIAILFVLQPEFATLVRDVFSEVLTFGGQSTQAQSLYKLEHFIIFGPLAQIGVIYYLGLAALVWCVWLVSRRYEPQWLVIAVFVTYYSIASGIMVRFAGKLVIVMSVLSGLGFVYLLSALELTTRPKIVERPSEETVGKPQEQSTDEYSLTIPSSWNICGNILLVTILIFGLNLMFILSFSSQVAHDEDHVEAATAIANHSDTVDREYPENHVLAPWQEYRMYNYFVSGESESETYGRYGYHRIYSFTSPKAPFRYTEKKPTGYIILTDIEEEVPEQGLYNRLYNDLNKSTEEFEALKNYQLIYGDEDDGILVYALVSGAELKLSGEQGSVLTLEKEVTVGDISFTYEREITVGENGTATVVVPYPGQYSIGNTSVTVSTEQVENGETVVVG
jgi:dolichyl-diphosphooligosaccharide--protein glycosyltransferase